MLAYWRYFRHLYVEVFYKLRAHKTPLHFHICPLEELPCLQPLPPTEHKMNCGESKGLFTRPVEMANRLGITGAFITHRIWAQINVFLGIQPGTDSGSHTNFQGSFQDQIVCLEDLIIYLYSEYIGFVPHKHPEKTIPLIWIIFYTSGKDEQSIFRQKLVTRPIIKYLTTQH